MIAALAVVAGCAETAPTGTPNADMTRRICIENGHTLGSEGFHRCFETTYATIMGTRQPAPTAAAARPVVCNRVGNAMVCN
jgi:hypothetical protein